MTTHFLKPCGLALLAILSTACQTHTRTPEQAREKWQQDRVWDQLFQSQEHELRKQRREENRR